jgi:peroxiredoxin family protein/TusA-related sulfurtransferase/rhodanese-related sulfurtransferase
MHGGVEDLEELELSYAPPYSSAKDPVNMAGFTASNVLTGLVKFAAWDSVEKETDAVLLDVREDAELAAYELPNAVHIPLGQLRSRLNELDPEKKIIAFCAIGVRSYNAVRILMNNGFRNVLLYPGGTRFYRATHPSMEEDDMNDSHMNAPVADSGAAAAPTAAQAIRVNCNGLQCPGPIMKVFETMKDMKDGERLEVSASDPGFTADIASWCRRTGNTLISNEHRGSDYVALLQKGSGSIAAPAVSAPAAAAQPEGKTIIVFDGDLDKVLASFIIANGAAAMGRPVTMFFTFWGLTALRKPEKQPVKKTFIESMFGGMLPRGTEKLHLSRMNMGGMGTAMMKKIMNDKNIDSLETLMKKAMANGVKIIACTMSMDVMGIKKEELIDGVELGGVGAYLGDAEESNVNLFI